MSGNTLVTDSQLLYEEISHIERLLFKMKKYDYARMVKGAYHQNLANTHWYDNVEMKMDLVDIKAEVSRLMTRGRNGAVTWEEVKPFSQHEERLRTLKNKLERFPSLRKNTRAKRQKYWKSWGSQNLFEVTAIARLSRNRNKN